ncbi:MAG: LamG domain-containing protein [Polyangiaceae bacterium]|nr:LamG domain-containing protein [Polyangiaceae bacterium]
MRAHALTLTVLASWLTFTACGGESDDGSGGTTSGGKGGSGGTTGGSGGTTGGSGGTTGGSGGTTGGSGGTTGGSGGTTGGTGGGATDGGADASDAKSDASDSGSDASDGGLSIGALRFDGTNDVVNLSTAAGAASETAFSSELWFRSVKQTGMLLEVHGGGADRSLYLDAGKVCFYVYTPSYSTICTTAATYADGVWHHAAGTLGAAGQYLYVDGASAASAPAVKTSAFSGDTGFRAGYGYIGPNGVLTYFAGDLDEIRVWSVQRTASEINASKSVTISPTTTGLQGYWKLDETGGATVAADATTPAHNGTLVGFTASPSPWISPGAF